MADDSQRKRWSTSFNEKREQVDSNCGDSSFYEVFRHPDILEGSSTVVAIYSHLPDTRESAAAYYCYDDV